MEKSFIINSTDMEYLYNSFHNSTVLQMCRMMLNSHLLNNGIEFCKGDCKDSMELNAELQSLVELSLIHI